MSGKRKRLVAQMQQEREVKHRNRRRRSHGTSTWLLEIGITEHADIPEFTQIKQELSAWLTGGCFWVGRKGYIRLLSEPKKATHHRARFEGAIRRLVAEEGVLATIDVALHPSPCGGLLRGSG